VGEVGRSPGACSYGGMQGLAISGAVEMEFSAVGGIDEAMNSNLLRFSSG